MKNHLRAFIEDLLTPLLEFASRFTTFSTKFPNAVFFGFLSQYSLEENVIVKFSVDIEGIEMLEDSLLSTYAQVVKYYVVVSNSIVTADLASVIVSRHYIIDFAVECLYGYLSSIFITLEMSLFGSTTLLARFMHSDVSNVHT